MQEGQINSSKHWRFGVKNALKTLKESVNAGFAFRYYFVCQLSFLIWTASSVSGGLPHWQFRFFPPTALALRAIARCFQMSLPTGQWPRYATAPGSRLVHWLGVAGRFAKVWFSSCSVVWVAIRRKTMTWNNPRYCRRWGFSMELFELDLPCTRIYPSFFCASPSWKQDRCQERTRGSEEDGLR